MTTNYIINPKFRDLIPPLSADEYQQLEANILKEGIRDPLVAWDWTIVDGHNRYEIAKKHGLSFDVYQKNFANEEEAELWIIDNQFGRRNLPDAERITLAQKKAAIIAGKAKERQREAGGDRKSAEYKENASVKSDKSDFEPINTRREVARIAGVSEGKVAQFEQVQKKAPELIPATRKNELSINAAYEVTKMEPEQRQEVVDRIEQGEAPKQVVAEVKAKPHVAYNSGNNEWYTPKEYIDAAREAMGSIDIDPASSDVANKVVGATEYYTCETNGLNKKLHGNVWLNPPYASDLIGKFVSKVVDERGDYEQAVVLVNNATETEWFNKLVSVASAVCFPKSRVKFYMPDGKTGQPLQGQAVIYIGNNKERFADAFKSLGWRCYPVGV